MIADNVPKLAPVWPHQVWYPLLLDLLIENSDTSPTVTRLVGGSEGKSTPL